MRPRRFHRWRTKGREGRGETEGKGQMQDGGGRDLEKEGTDGRRGVWEGSMQRREVVTRPGYKAR